MCRGSVEGVARLCMLLVDEFCCFCRLPLLPLRHSPISLPFDPVLSPLVVRLLLFFPSLILLLVRPPSPDDMLIFGWWSSSPQTEAKETLNSAPIELHLYSRPVVIAALILSTRPDAPPPPVALQSRLFSSPEFPPVETPKPSPAWSCALMLSSSLVAPPAPLGAGGACPVGGSKPSLTAHL